MWKYAEKLQEIIYQLSFVIVVSSQKACKIYLKYPND